MRTVSSGSSRVFLWAAARDAAACLEGIKTRAHPALSSRGKCSFGVYLFQWPIHAIFYGVGLPTSERGEFRRLRVGAVYAGGAYEVHVERPYVGGCAARAAASRGRRPVVARGVLAGAVRSPVSAAARPRGSASASPGAGGAWIASPAARAAVALRSRSRSAGPPARVPPDISASPCPRPPRRGVGKEARQTQLSHEPRDVGRRLDGPAAVLPTRRGLALAPFGHGPLGPRPQLVEGRQGGAGRRLRRRGVSRRAHRARRRRVALEALRWLCS